MADKIHIYSDEWWAARVQVLRQTFPRGLSAESRLQLTIGTLGKDRCDALEYRCDDSYRLAFDQGGAW